MRTPYFTRTLIYSQFKETKDQSFYRETKDQRSYREPGWSQIKGDRSSIWARTSFDGEGGGTEVEMSEWNTKYRRVAQTGEDGNLRVGEEDEVNLLPPR